MRGTSGSVFKAVILNPLVWIAWVLTYFTIHYEGEKNALAIFLNPYMYRNLAIGAAIYVALFDRHYTAGRAKLDIPETLLAVITTMYTILLVWGITLSLIVNYHLGGEWYSAELRERYSTKTASDDEERPLPRNFDTIKNMNLNSGQKLKIIPNADGTFTVEVLD